MEFFDTLSQVKSNWSPYKKWETEQSKKEKQNEELRRKYPPSQEELTKAKNYGRTIVETINTMDQHSIDKSEDAALVIKNATTGLGFIGLFLGSTVGVALKHLPQTKAKFKAPDFILGVIGGAIGASLAGLFGEVYGAQIEKQASRIARFQTRENDLKDYKNFVIYNDEQLEKAEKIAQTLPEVEENKKDITIKKSFNPIASFKKAKKTTDELREDSKAYSQWKEKFEKTEKEKKENFPNMKVPPEELSKAEKDRDNILHTIKKIENYSLNYMMNMKLTIFSAQLALDGAGLGIGMGIYAIINGLQKKHILKEKSAFVNWAKSAGIKFIPIAVIIGTIGPTVKLLKDSARIGRFKAKQELLNNPQNFIAFDDQQRKNLDVGQMSQNKAIKEEGFIEKFKKDLNEIKRFKKDYNEYHNYMNTERKHELKLQEALKQVEITKEQEIQAKELQKKAFLSFEKMDEKAQRFIDDTDAGVDVTRHTITTTISTICKVLVFSVFIKKANAYNNGKELGFKDMFTLYKHFTTKDIFTLLGIGLIPTAVNIPLAVKGIQIKKEAGKIGVMQAMKDLNDPKNFLDEDKFKQTQASS